MKIAQQRAQTLHLKLSIIGSNESERNIIIENLAVIGVECKIIKEKDALK